MRRKETSVQIGFHASHEQFAPSELIELVKHAEQAGFGAAMCSDHFYPWGRQQGQSGYAWSWLGAALTSTGLNCGVVSAPGERYHPPIIAQAAATLSEMFPGRFWIAVGSGQFLNESITGGRWPPKAERNRRLRECVDVMRALWAGETITHHGLIDVEEAKLYTLPETPPLMLAAAITPETAEWAGSWAGGLITVSQPRDELRKVVDAFRSGGGAGKPMFLKVQLSYAANDEEAFRQGKEQWAANVFPSAVLAELRSPIEFEKLGSMVSDEGFSKMVRVSADAARHADWLRGDAELGFERLYLHNVNRNQRLFIEHFGEKVLPALATGGMGEQGRAA